MKLTREDILNMPVGQDTDVLIAEKVLKLSANEWNKRFFNRMTEYSSDIACAWKVVEKMMSDGYVFSSNGNDVCGNMVYNFRFFKDDKEFYSGITEHNLPLAICRAALIAVMEAENER